MEVSPFGYSFIGSSVDKGIQYLNQLLRIFDEKIKEEFFINLQKKILELKALPGGNERLFKWFETQNPGSEMPRTTNLFYILQLYEKEFDYKLDFFKNERAYNEIVKSSKPRELIMNMLSLYEFLSSIWNIIETNYYIATLEHAENIKIQERIKDLIGKYMKELKTITFSKTIEKEFNENFAGRKLVGLRTEINIRQSLLQLFQQIRTKYEEIPENYKKDTKIARLQKIVGYLLNLDSIFFQYRGDKGVRVVPGIIDEFYQYYYPQNSPTGMDLFSKVCNVLYKIVQELKTSKRRIQMLHEWLKGKVANTSTTKLDFFLDMFEKNLIKADNTPNLKNIRYFYRFAKQIEFEMYTSDDSSFIKFKNLLEKCGFMIEQPIDNETLQGKQARTQLICDLKPVLQEIEFFKKMEEQKKELENKCEERFTQLQQQVAFQGGMNRFKKSCDDENYTGIDRSEGKKVPRTKFAQKERVRRSTPEKPSMETRKKRKAETSSSTARFSRRTSAPAAPMEIDSDEEKSSEDEIMEERRPEEPFERRKSAPAAPSRRRGLRARKVVDYTAGSDREFESLLGDPRIKKK
mgnify:CR=1 FL=1